MAHSRVRGTSSRAGTSRSLDRRTLLKGTAATAGAAALGGIVSGQAPFVQRAAAQESRGTITILSAEPFFGSWDPSAHTILANIHAEWNTFDRLIALDWNTKELKPQLAESWSFVEPNVLEGRPLNRQLTRSDLMSATAERSISISCCIFCNSHCAM